MADAFIQVQGLLSWIVDTVIQVQGGLSWLLGFTVKSELDCPLAVCGETGSGVPITVCLSTSHSCGVGVTRYSCPWPS